MVKRISFSLLFLSFLCCSYAQEVRDAQHFSSMIGDTLSSSEIDKIISRASDKLFKKSAKLHMKKGMYLLRMSDRQVGEEGTKDSLEAIIEAGSVCMNEIKVLGGEIHGIEEDTLSTLYPYMTRNELYHMVQVAPIMMEDPFWEDSRVSREKKLNVRTPFVRRTSKKESEYVLIEGGVYGGEIGILASPYPNISVNPGPHGMGIQREKYKEPIGGIPHTKEQFHVPYAASERYDVSGVKVKCVDGQEVYRIDLRSKYPNAAREVVGTVEIDDENRLLRYDGELLGQSIWVMKEGKRNAVRLNCQSHVEYTYRHGFMEVESSCCTVTYDNHEVQILLTNLNETKVKSKKKVKAERNLIQAIKEAGYDPNMWKESGI